MGLLKSEEGEVKNLVYWNEEMVCKDTENYLIRVETIFCQNFYCK